MTITYTNKPGSDCNFDFNPVKFAVNSNRRHIQKLYKTIVSNTNKPYETAVKILLTFENEKEHAAKYFIRDYWNPASETKQRIKAADNCKYFVEYTKNYINKHAAR